MTCKRLSNSELFFALKRGSADKWSSLPVYKGMALFLGMYFVTLHEMSCYFFALTNHAGDFC